MLASPFVRALSVAAIVGGLAFQPAALAIPIGEFAWNEYNDTDCDLFGLCGQHFAVSNFSELTLGSDQGATFFDVFVDLDTADPVSLELGNIAPDGSSSQSTEDLSRFLFSFAQLRVTFVSTLPGSLQFLSPDGGIVTGLASLGSLLVIDYAVDDVTPVPEPATFLLLVGGLAGVALARKARDGAPEKSRMKRSRHALAT